MPIADNDAYQDLSPLERQALTEPGTYELELKVRVRIKVTDPEQIRRCVDNIDGWRDHLYDLRTVEDVLQHLAFNCAVNGVEHASRLDGWADLDPMALTMEVTRDVDYEEVWIGGLTGGSWQPWEVIQ